MLGTVLAELGPGIFQHTLLFQGVLIRREAESFSPFGDEDEVGEELEKEFDAVGILLGWDSDNTGEETHSIPGLLVEGEVALGSHRASESKVI